jgi:hypothetical protein
MKNISSENSHVSVPTATSQQLPSAEDSAPASDPAENIAERLVPRKVRELKFRAHSFAAKLTDVQRTTLFAWMNTLPTREVVKKVAAPPPQGFGLKVCSTSIDRLKSFVKNVTPMTIASDALDTAADLLESHEPGGVSALHEALHVMLYSSAVKYAARGAEPKIIDQTLAALTRLEKLRILNSASAPVHHQPSPPAMRHHVHLTISPSTPPPLQPLRPEKGRARLSPSRSSTAIIVAENGKDRG